MATKRIVDTGFWLDDKVVECFSPEDKYFMLYLLTNPHTTQLGIYPISPKVASFELGYSVDSVNVLLDRFENKYDIIRYCKSTKEVAIKNYLVYSIVKGGKPVQDLLEKELKQVKSTRLITYVFNNLYDKNNINVTVRNILNKYSNVNYNDNDNDNDVSSIRFVQVENKSTIMEEYNKIKDLVIKENKGSIGNGSKVCEWCGKRTNDIHQHHYPIPKRLGGNEVVNICPECHKKFHDIESLISKFAFEYKEINKYNFSSDVKYSILNWLAYKKEKKQTYKEIGLKTLLNKLQQDVELYGKDYVIDAINNSIAQNYSGIFANKNIKNDKTKSKKGVYERNYSEEELNNIFSDIDDDNYDF